MKELPVNHFPQDEYPIYFSLLQNKVVMLSSLDKENPLLGQAVAKLIADGKAIGVTVVKPDDTQDMIVYMKRTP